MKSCALDQEDSIFERFVKVTCVGKSLAQQILDPFTDLALELGVLLGLCLLIELSVYQKAIRENRRYPILSLFDALCKLRRGRG